MIQALNPQVQQIREKFKDNKELQNQLVALLYDEAKVIMHALICDSLINFM